MLTDTIILPGIGGSGKGHWQTLWKERGMNGPVFQPTSWASPDLDDWSEALGRAVRSAEHPPLLVAHSLACLLVAHWGVRQACSIAGAVLIAVPDPESPLFPRAQARSFSLAPRKVLPFPSLIIASTDDPYASLGYAQRCAGEWDAGLIVVGAVGHINTDSGLADWPFGAALVEAFRAGVSPRTTQQGE
jgi:predicted alpha/beta hydrolase family esterase